MDELCCVVRRRRCRVRVASVSTSSGGEKRDRGEVKVSRSRSTAAEVSTLVNSTPHFAPHPRVEYSVPR